MEVDDIILFLKNGGWWIAFLVIIALFNIISKLWGYLTKPLREKKERELKEANLKALHEEVESVVSVKMNEIQGVMSLLEDNVLLGLIEKQELQKQQVNKFTNLKEAQKHYIQSIQKLK